MKIHSLLADPHAVLVYRTPVPGSPRWEDFQHAAGQVLAALQVEFEGEKIVVKPNVTSGESFADPDNGITTHPGFVQGLLEYARRHGARRRGLFVLEDPRNSNDDEPRHWRGTGYPEVAAATGAKLRCSTSRSTVKKTVPDPLVHPMRRVSRLAVAPNTVLINVPKMKTHNLGITTLCMKNLMGVDYVCDRHYCGQAWGEFPKEILQPDRPNSEWMTRELHEIWEAGLGRRLADLAKVVQPRLNVVEGIVARDGTGFQRGRNFPLGMAVAGTNMVAVDSVASYLMGFDPRKLVYLRVAAAAGLGCNDLAQLRILTVREGALEPCADPEALRARPRFRVISGILGEEADDPA